MLTASQYADLSGSSVVANEARAAPWVLSSAMRACAGDGDGLGPFRSFSANERSVACAMSPCAANYSRTGMSRIGNVMPTPGPCQLRRGSGKRDELRLCRADGALPDGP